MRHALPVSILLVAGSGLLLLAPPARARAEHSAAERDGTPALVAAATAGQPGRLRELLRSGARPDAADRSGWTALHAAAERGDLESARSLLDAGATPDLRARGGRGTALDVAERSGRTDLARLLRARGARGSGKSTGDTVCVRPWQGEGYCGTIESVDPTRAELRVTGLVGCDGGCAAEAACSAGRPVGRNGLRPGDRLWVPFSCLTHTGVEPR